MIKTLIDIITFFQRNGLIEAQSLYYDEIGIRIITANHSPTIPLPNDEYQKELASLSQKIWLSDLVDLIARNSTVNEAEVLPLSFEHVAGMTATLEGGA